MHLASNEKLIKSNESQKMTENKISEYEIPRKAVGE